MNENTKNYGLLGGFDSAAHLIRFCIAVSFILGLLYLIISVLMKKIEPDFSIELSENGGIKITKNNQSKVILLVPASVLWTDTGIEVDVGDKVSVRASGVINLAVHQLVDAVRADEIPGLELGWLGPEGYKGLKDPFQSILPRGDVLIETDANYGQLLAYIQPEGEKEPNKFFPRPNNIRAIGEGKKIIYQDEKRRVGKIFLTVNDVVLCKNETCDNALEDISEKCEGNIGMSKERWHSFINSKYFDVFYNDNIGEFLVEVSVEKE